MRMSKRQRDARMRSLFRYWRNAGWRAMAAYRQARIQLAIFEAYR